MTLDYLHEGVLSSPAKPCMAGRAANPGYYIDVKHQSFQLRIPKDIRRHQLAVEVHANLLDIWLEFDAPLYPFSTRWAVAGEMGVPTHWW